MTETIQNRLRIRANIRRQIPTRKSVQEGKPDRLADLLDAAADEIDRLEAVEEHLDDVVRTVVARIEALIAQLKQKQENDMAYAEHGADSDVHVFKAHDGKRQIWVTHVAGKPSGQTDLTLRGLHARLLELREGGARIPKSCMERVERELAHTRDAADD